MATDSPPSRSRLIARFILLGVVLAVLGVGYSFGRPLYWRFYATTIRPFRDSGRFLSNPAPFEGDLPVNVTTPLEKAAAPSAATNTSTQPKVEKASTSATESKADSKKPNEQSKPGGGEAAEGGKSAAGVKKDTPAEQPKVDKQKTAAKEEDKVPPKTERPDPMKEVNPEDPYFELNRNNAYHWSRASYLVVTWTNLHYLDFAITWAEHMNKFGGGYVVGAMDDDTLKEMYNRWIPTFRMNTGLSKKDFGWGSKEFHKMGKWKVNLIRETLNLDVNVIISDIDTVWLRDPIPFMSKYPEADVLTSSDLLHNTVSDESLELYPEGAGPSANIGIMMFRKTAIPMVDEWVKMIETKEIWDQAAFNEIFRAGMRGTTNDPKHLFKAFNGNVTMGILPVSLFASGHTFFVQRMAETLGMKAYVAHATFQYSGTVGKRHRFREFMLFADPPGYYDYPQGFITVRMDIPKDMLEKSGPATQKSDLANVAGHFTLMHHQLKQIRAALAIATLTGRAIIFPELWCGQDKYWAPHAGTIGGSSFKLPFRCPADHVFDLEGGWQLDDKTFGPVIQYREHSFLDNPRTPDTLKKSKLVIEVCDGPKEGCANGDKVALVTGNTAKIEPLMSSTDFLAATWSLSSYKVWELADPLKTLGKWTDGEAYAKFKKRLDHITTTFCCVDASPAGHVWYDFWFDEPHKDRFNREHTVPWTPKLGDSRRRLLGRAELMSEAEEVGRQQSMPGQGWW